jgi:hypothetical protein
MVGFAEYLVSAPFHIPRVNLLAMAMPGAAEVDWFAYVDHYCERVAQGLWGEPLNTLSNAAFLISAGYVFHRQQREAVSDWPVLILAALVVSVGIGSILFHTLANHWTLIADLGPIAVFIHAFFFAALLRFLKLNVWVAGLATVGLLLLSPWISVVMEPVLGASAAYTSGLIATFGVALAVPLSGRGPAPRLLLAAGFAFVTALIFRQLDHVVCDYFPIGTHFLWHVFNGITIGLALVAFDNARPRESEGRSNQRQAMTAA